MEVMTEYNQYTKEDLNALNDRRIHALHEFSIESDSYMIYEWNENEGCWKQKNMKLIPHTKIYLTNLEVCVRIHPPEKEDFTPQVTPTDLSDPEFAKMVKNARTRMSKLKAPACLANLKLADNEETKTISNK